MGETENRILMLFGDVVAVTAHRVRVAGLGDDRVRMGRAEGLARR
jgi:hypothetical protein